MKTPNAPVKGFRDYTGEEAQKRKKIRGIVEKTFQLYGFEPAETPVIEYEKFVKGENKEDEAVSDTYKLKDKGNRKLALRYEFTFQLKRIAKGKKLPYKRYQIGPVFRDEPVGANRLRQFTTCEADIVSSTIQNEAEILALAKQILINLGINPVIYINNRKLMNEILDEFNISKKDKEKVIREIDKLDKLSESKVKTNLKKYKAEKIIDALKKPEKYFKGYKNYQKIKELKKYCRYFNVKVNFQPSLARGLSYYNGTIFEIKSKKIKETIVGGGAFLVNNIQSIGFGTSIERLSALADTKELKTDYLLISLNQDSATIELAQRLRKKRKSCSIYYGKPSKALSYADSYNINNVIFVGEKEIKSKKFVVKDMKTGKESTLKF